MLERKLPKVVIRELDIYTPVIKDEENFTIEKKYFDKYDTNKYLHFPVILNDDDKTLWKYGNLFLLNKIKINSEIDSQTLKSKRLNLELFKKWVDKENIGYLSSPKRKFLGPVYQYRRYLNGLMSNNEIAPKTLQNRIGAIVEFYKYLIKEEGFEFKYSLWDDSVILINITDREGFQRVIKKETRDVSKIKNTRILNNEESYIKDGSNLIPLEKEVQSILVEILNKSKNIEMRLSFFLSLTTGARIQSIFTLRIKHFEKPVTENDSFINVKIGYGTLCDTKYGKQNILKIPVYIYNMIRVYIKSPRGQSRRSRSKHIFDNNNDCYVFMNNRGIPYYCAKNDPYKILYSDSINGVAIRQFICNTLRKEFKNYGIDFTHSFHDLRATFLMNYYDSKINLVDKGLMTISQLLINMMQLVGHSSLTITEGYMNFRNKNKIKEYLQDDYEKHLEDLIHG